MHIVRECVIVSWSGGVEPLNESIWVTPVLYHSSVGPRPLATPKSSVSSLASPELFSDVEADHRL